MCRDPSMGIVKPHAVPVEALLESLSPLHVTPATNRPGGTS